MTTRSCAAAGASSSTSPTMLSAPMATSGAAEGKPQPLLWAREYGKGRGFVSIPGHYSWSFDDPLFRLLLLRGIAWSAREPVDRFQSLIWPGARLGLR